MNRMQVFDLSREKRTRCEGLHDLVRDEVCATPWSVSANQISKIPFPQIVSKRCGARSIQKMACIPSGRPTKKELESLQQENGVLLQELSRVQQELLTKVHPFPYLTEANHNSTPNGRYLVTRMPCERKEICD